MSTEAKPDWFNIQRKTPTLDILYGSEVFSFDYFNTTIFYFAEQYRQFNHLYHEHNGKWLHFFNCSGMMDELHEMGFPAHYAEWPSEDDVEAYISMEMQELEQ